MRCNKNIFFSLVFITIAAIAGCKKEAEESRPANPATNPGTGSTEPLTPAEAGTIRARVNGAEKNTVASYTDAQTTSVVRMEISGPTAKDEMISLVLPTIKKTGKYDSVAVARYVIFPESGPSDALIWIASSADLTVTKFDTLEKKMSGTFRFKAFPSDNSKATGYKDVTEGTFTDVYIRK